MLTNLSVYFQVKDSKVCDVDFCIWLCYTSALNRMRPWDNSLSTIASGSHLVKYKKLLIDLFQSYIFMLDALIFLNLSVVYKIVRLYN